MDEPLLQTKLYIPINRSDPSSSHRTRFVPRPRLMERLNEGLAGRLTVISAPAGFGKTTLVSSWLEPVKLPAAWVSLDEEDNDLVRFLTYLIAALQTIRPDTGKRVLPMLQSSPLPNSYTLLTLLINDLMAVSEKTILVLDDYHVIQTKAIDQALVFFIDHMPPRMHLVISSRVDPRFSLARLRSRGQLNELRGVDLSFTQAESAQFLEQITNLSLTQVEVAALDKHLEGWIAGLQMAALFLRQRKTVNIAQLIENLSGSNRYIMDYLVDEVLQQQPAEVQTFLLYTSILDQFCGPLCEALFQENNASDIDQNSNPPSVILDAHRVQELVVYLEHANLFITPLDDQRHWYCYHPLFADLLRQRLNQMYSDQVATLHLRASQWYEQTGMTAPAVRHALAAQASTRAAILVEQAAPALIQRGELARLLTWFDMLPDEEVRYRPLLGLYYCWSLIISGQRKSAAARFEAIEKNLIAKETKQTSEVRGHLAALRAWLARLTGDFALAIPLSQQALVLLPEQASLLRAMVDYNLAAAYYHQGQFEPALRLLNENIATGRTAERTATTLYSIFLNTQLLRVQGRLDQALQLCQDGLELVTRHRWKDLPSVGILYVAFGGLLLEQNELTQAEEYLEKGINVAQGGGVHNILIVGHIWQAWLHQTQGHVKSSHEAIQSALYLIEHYEADHVWLATLATCCQARLWIAQGNLTAASLWAETSDLKPEEPPVPYFHEMKYLTLVRLLIAQRNLESAESLLRRLHSLALSAGRNGSLIEILILQSLSLARQKHMDDALSVLAQALALAEPEGFVRIFLDEGAPMTELLRLAVAQGVHVPYALRLLNAVGKGATPAQPLIEPLSERELEVLRRVAAGYSNQEIAQELVVALSTVKKHISNIYDKLEAESRTQAVARARELGLL